MELGGVSVDGRSSGSGGAYLVKDLTAFETQLGGLVAFAMVSDGTADDEGGGAAARLAVQAADAYLESLLLSLAAGTTPVVEPALVLETIVAEANAAIDRAAAEPDASSTGATFFGALMSAGRVWFARVGGGDGYLIRGGEAHALTADTPPSEALVPEVVPAESEVPTDASAAVVQPAPAREDARIEVGSAELSPGDAVVLLGLSASAALSGADIPEISCAACDARVAAKDLADSAARAEPEHSVTVAVWSADSTPFAPAPPAVSPGVRAAVPIIAANNEVSTPRRAETVFLWVMSAWIVLVFLVLGAGMLVSRPQTSVNTADGSSAGGGGMPGGASQSTTVATGPVSTTPTGTAAPEFPKQLTVPRKVKGGLWLRKGPTTLGGSNQVAQLKGGVQIQAVATTDGTDERGRTQEFYVIRVSDISAKQIVKSASYPWPPPKSVKKVYVFAGSFDAP